MSMDLDRDRATALFPVLGLEDRLACLQDLPPELLGGPAVLPTDEVEGSHPEELVPAISKHPGGDRVDLDETSREAVLAEFVDMDGIVRRVEDLPEPGLAHFQRSLFLPPLFDLAESPVSHPPVGPDLADELGHVVDEDECIRLASLEEGVDRRSLEPEAAARQGSRDEMGMELGREEGGGTALEHLLDPACIPILLQVGEDLPEVATYGIRPWNARPFLGSPVPADDRVVWPDYNDACR